MSKYSQIERERRFLVPHLPEDLGFGTTIEDHYVHGTRLRLRRMATPDGDIYKLTQKIPRAPSLCEITTIYLNEAEYLTFRALPADALRKTRYRIPYDGKIWAVDVIDAPPYPLVLTETELDAGEDVLPPPFAGTEVTDDPAYAGAELARSLTTDGS